MTTRSAWLVEDPNEFAEITLGEPASARRFAECRIIVDADAEVVVEHRDGNEAALALANRIVEDGPAGVRGVLDKPRSVRGEYLFRNLPPYHYAECLITLGQEIEITVRHRQGIAALMDLVHRIADVRDPGATHGTA